MAGQNTPPNATDANNTPAPPQQGNNNAGQQSQEGNQQPNNQNATGNDNKTGDKPDEIKLPEMTPEQLKLYNSQLAAARKAGETKGKTDAEKAINDAKTAEETEAARQKGEFENLYNTEQSQHNATKAELATVKADSDKLRAALEANVPNAVANYKRIVGSTYEEMVEDAKTLAASFGQQAHRDANTPPVVPNANDGGQYQQQQQNNTAVTDEQLNKNRSGYNLM